MATGQQIMLNVKRTDLIIFCPPTIKLDHSTKFNLYGEKVTFSHSIKYLGVLLDEHLKRTKQVTLIKKKLS